MEFCCLGRLGRLGHLGRLGIQGSAVVQMSAILLKYATFEYQKKLITIQSEKNVNFAFRLYFFGENTKPFDSQVLVYYTGRGSRLGVLTGMATKTFKDCTVKVYVT